MGNPPAAHSTDLIALICSRLCHDLAGSIGAVNNGVELLAEETDAAMREEAIGLIAQSAHDAARRLAFFRLALGASGGLHDIMHLQDLARVAQAYFTGGKLTLALPQQDAELSKPLGKALLLGLAQAGTALPRGGMLGLTAAGDGWSIRGEGPMLRWNEHMAAGLDKAQAELTEPAAAISRYMLQQAESAGFALSADTTETTITLRFAR
jgi:histidine phosphotransferase ChpT